MLPFRECAAPASHILIRYSEYLLLCVVFASLDVFCGDFACFVAIFVLCVYVRCVYV